MGTGVDTGLENEFDAWFKKRKLLEILLGERVSPWLASIPPMAAASTPPMAAASTPPTAAVVKTDEQHLASITRGVNAISSRYLVNDFTTTADNTPVATLTLRGEALPRSLSLNTQTADGRRCV
jgi:hypothetical protein